MAGPNHLPSSISHRPYPLPSGKWAYYQEWNKVLFLHWKVPVEALRPLVPERLHMDTMGGDAYVSLVAFTMQKIRPRFLPSILAVSDFDEINVRTYIDNDHRKGVYFFSIEAGKQLSAFIAKALSGLPYEKSAMQRAVGHYRSSHAKKGFALNAAYGIGNPLPSKSELDRWLTERYCLYGGGDGALFRYDIHHPEWPLRAVALERLDLNYAVGTLRLGNLPDHAHYSEGVQVLAWPRKEV